MGDVIGTTIGDTRADTRSLDYSASRAEATPNRCPCWSY